MVKVMNRMLPLCTRQSFWGTCRFWNPRIDTSPLIRLTHQSYNTSWQSIRARYQIQKQQHIIGKVQHMLESTDSSQSGSFRIMLTAAQKNNVMELIKLFDEVKDLGLSPVVFILSKIGRNVYYSQKKRDELEKEMSIPETSVCLKLLNLITENMSACKASELGEIIRALGKMQEKSHPIFQTCEEEILYRGVGSFDYKTVAQILVGLSSMNRLESKLFGEVEKAILDGKLGLDVFDERAFAQTLLAYAKAGQGSDDLFQCFLDEILKRDLYYFKNNDLIQSLWSFAKRGFSADLFFEKGELELLFRKGHSEISKHVDVAMVLWAYASQGRGSSEFFERMSEKVLCFDIKLFQNDELSQITWALGKAGVTSELVFSLIEAEFCKRGVESFSDVDRNMLIEGLKYAKRGEMLSSMVSA